MLDCTGAPVLNPFPIVHKPNALDRDRTTVPTGWNSCEMICEAWARGLTSNAGIDLDRESGARKLLRVLCAGLEA